MILMARTSTARRVDPLRFEASDPVLVFQQPILSTKSIYRKHRFRCPHHTASRATCDDCWWESSLRKAFIWDETQETQGKAGQTPSTGARQQRSCIATGDCDRTD